MKKKFMLAVLLAVGLIMTMSSTSVVWAQAAPRTIEITAQRFSYNPGEITLKKGQPVVLALKSLDVAHGLRIRDLNVKIKVRAGGTTEVQFTPQNTAQCPMKSPVFSGVN